jgi:long-subunit fatty acid transport protein
MSAGVFWEPLPDGQLRIGASYAVRPSFGQTRLGGSLRQHYQNQDFDKDIDLLLTYPDVIRLGATTMPWGRTVELRLDAEYVTWSAFKRQCVVTRGKACDLRPDGSEQNPGDVLIALRRDWKNTVAVRAGAGYFLDDKTELYASAGFDTSAVSKATLEATYPDAFKIIGSIGARREVAAGVVIGASYTFVPYLQVETGHQNSFGLAGVSRTPNQDGTYNSKLMFFNLNAAFAL